MSTPINIIVDEYLPDDRVYIINPGEMVVPRTSHSFWNIDQFRMHPTIYDASLTVTYDMLNNAAASISRSGYQEIQYIVNPFTYDQMIRGNWTTLVNYGVGTKYADGYDTFYK